MQVVPILAFLCIVGGSVLLLVGVLASFVGLGPAAARVDRLENVAAAQRNPRRVWGARLQVVGVGLALLGVLLVNFVH